jgi:transcription-repair coupling factor (superfamily II helicase)
MAQKIEELVPRFAGRVRPRPDARAELERIMRDFYHRRFNILVCTTIVESGIDVPSANTIIIDRADKLGWPSCTSCAGASGARTTAPTPT